MFSAHAILGSLFVAPLILENISTYQLQISCSDFTVPFTGGLQGKPLSALACVVGKQRLSVMYDRQLTESHEKLKEVIYTFKVKSNFSEISP